MALLKDVKQELPGARRPTPKLPRTVRTTTTARKSGLRMGSRGSYR